MSAGSLFFIAEIAQVMTKTRRFDSPNSSNRVNSDWGRAQSTEERGRDGGKGENRLEELRSPPSSLERRAARLEETHEAFLALSFDEAVKPYLSPCHAEDEYFDFKSKDFFTLPMNLLSAGRDRNSLLSGCPSAA
ncbi:hypothetical protein LIER_22682 [Lithospermum erythrorhizon]|uniref:Uncharacterized protein n=1 Tax=Lithospermum erythrorhizon TaxID=34254 RepID=A0AAV3QY76_LITER